MAGASTTSDLAGLAAGKEGLDLALHEGGRVDQDSRLADGLGAGLAVAGLVLLPPRSAPLRHESQRGMLVQYSQNRPPGCSMRWGLAQNGVKSWTDRMTSKSRSSRLWTMWRGSPLRPSMWMIRARTNRAALTIYLDRVGGFTKIENPGGVLGPDFK